MQPAEQRKYQLFPKDKPLPVLNVVKSVDPETAFEMAMGEKSSIGPNLRLRLNQNHPSRRRKISVPELEPMTTVQEVSMDSRECCCYTLLYVVRSTANTKEKQQYPDAHLSTSVLPAHLMVGGMARSYLWACWATSTFVLAKVSQSPSSELSALLLSDQRLLNLKLANLLLWSSQQQISHAHSKRKAQVRSSDQTAHLRSHPLSMRAQTTPPWVGHESPLILRHPIYHFLDQPRPMQRQSLRCPRQYRRPYLILTVQFLSHGIR